MYLVFIAFGCLTSGVQKLKFLSSPYLSVYSVVKIILFKGGHVIIIINAFIWMSEVTANSNPQKKHNPSIVFWLPTSENLTLSELFRFAGKPVSLYEVIPPPPSADDAGFTLLLKREVETFFCSCLDINILSLDV